MGLRVDSLSFISVWKLLGFGGKVSVLRDLRTLDFRV